MIRVLAGVVALWAMVAVVPLGAWLAVADLAYYADAWAAWWRTALLAGLAALLVVVATGGRAAGWLRAALAAPARLDRVPFLVLLGALAAVEAAVVSVVCFARQPQTIDAWVQQFQARVFLSGAAIAPAPRSVAHFATLFMPITARGWYSQYPPLHAALLAVGLAFDQAWVVTPVLTGLLPAATYAVGRATGDERIARTAAVLVLLSPFVVAMGASGMNHVPAALSVAAALAVLAPVARGRPWAFGVLGAAIGLGVGLRPLDATVAALVALPAVAHGARAGGVRALGAGVLAGLAALAPTLLYNAATTGSPLRFTYAATWRGLELGLGHDVPWGERLTAARALALTAIDGHQLDVYLLEWPLPVTLLAAAALWTKRGRRLAAPAAYVAALAGALFFYFHRDTLYGPRLLFSAVPAVLVLVAATLVALADLRRRVGWRALAVGDVALVAIAAVALVSAATLAPRRLASYRTIGTPLALAPDADARAAGIHDAVVVVPDGLGSRLLARLWALGVPMADADRLYHAFDACTLGARLAAAEGAGTRGDALVAALRAESATADRGRAVPGLTRDPALRIPSDGRIPPACADEIRRDREGMLQFAAYLWLNDARLDGDVVWARAMGPADDTALATLFPGRALYRYAHDGTAARFERIGG